MDGDQAQAPSIPHEHGDEQRHTKKRARTKREPLIVASDHTQRAESSLDACEEARTADASGGMAARDDRFANMGACEDEASIPQNAAAVWPDARWQQEDEPQGGGRCCGSGWGGGEGGAVACGGVGSGGMSDVEGGPDSDASRVMVGGAGGMAAVKVITASPSLDLGRVLGSAGGRKAAGEAQWIGGVRVLTASES